MPKTQKFRRWHWIRAVFLSSTVVWFFIALVDIFVSTFSDLSMSELSQILPPGRSACPGIPGRPDVPWNALLFKFCPGYPDFFQKPWNCPDFNCSALIWILVPWFFVNINICQKFACGVLIVSLISVQTQFRIHNAQNHFQSIWKPLFSKIFCLAASFVISRIIIYSLCSVSISTTPFLIYRCQRPK